MIHSHWGMVGAILLPILRLPFLAGLLVYALASLAASALIAARAGWRHLLRLPVALATLHLSYGIGFLAGLIHFGLPKGEVEIHG